MLPNSAVDSASVISDTLRAGGDWARNLQLSLGIQHLVFDVGSAAKHPAEMLQTGLEPAERGFPPLKSEPGGLQLCLQLLEFEALTALFP